MVLSDLFVRRASIFSFKKQTIPAYYREERYLDVSNGTINFDFLVDSNYPEQGLDFLVYKDSQKIDSFPHEVNNVPTCCTPAIRHISCVQNHIILRNNAPIYYTYITANISSSKSENNNIKKKLILGNTAINLTNKGYTNTDEPEYYVAFIANCGNQKIFVSGNVEYNSQTNPIDNRLLPVIRSSLLLGISSIIIIMFSLDIVKIIRWPSSQHTPGKVVVISSLLLEAISQFLFILYFILLAKTLIEYNVILIIISILRSLSRTLILMLSITNLYPDQKIYNWKAILLFSLLFIGHSYDLFELVHGLPKKLTGNWGCGFGRPAFMYYFTLSIECIVAVVRHLFNIYEPDNLDERRSIFEGRLIISAIIYAVGVFVNMVAHLDLNLVQARNYDWVGYILEPTHFIALISINILYQSGLSVDGFQQIDAQGIGASLVGNGFKRKKVSVEIVNEDDDQFDTDDGDYLIKDVPIV